MTEEKRVIVDSPESLAQALGLLGAEVQEWQVQYDLLKKLRHAVQKEALTHAEVAKLGKTSRTRVTAILNGNLDGVSTDLLIQLLASLGYRVRVSVSLVRPAA
jgi:predicted XRE-type DNA-binding protein